MTKRDLILRRREISDRVRLRKEARRDRARVLHVLRDAETAGLDVDKFADRDARSIRWAIDNVEAKSSQYY